MINMLKVVLTLFALLTLTNGSGIDPKAPNFDLDFLTTHNVLRQLHGLGPLVYNSTLNAYAQTKASALARVDHLHHFNSGYGENLHRSWSSEEGFTLDGTSPVNSWYSEIRDYNYETGAAFIFGADIGHFTQVVWRTTTQLGVGVARSASNSIYVVGIYSPPGNIPGQYFASVPRKVARTLEPVDSDNGEF